MLLFQEKILRSVSNIDDTISGATMFFDVDGTLVPDGEKNLQHDVVHKIASLRSKNNVYLCSNKKDIDRLMYISNELNVPYIHTKNKKPRKSAIGDVKVFGREVFVVGDKWITDGLLSARLGGVFLKVDPIKSEKFSIKVVRWVDEILHGIFITLRSARVWQWVKNILIFAPLFFAGDIFGEKLLLATYAFIAFSLVASSVYIFNDLKDLSLDSTHPIKKYRPIAAGLIDKASAFVLSLSILFCGLSIAFVKLPLTALYIIGGYFFVSLLYSQFLKHIAPVDLVVVASFYVVRVVVGGVATNTYFSPWIVLSVLFLALLIITGKRYSESVSYNARPVLQDYSKDVLYLLFGATTALVLVFYGLYTVLGHDEPLMIYSVFFVIIALFRYAWLLTSGKNIEVPEQVLFSDPVMLVSSLLWVLYMGYIFYF